MSGVMFGRVRERIFSSRKAPAQSSTWARQVRDRKYDGSAKAMAADYGVVPRTVLRWIDGTRTPTKYAQRLRFDAISVQTTPRGRQRKARQLRQRGIFSGFSARVSRVNDFSIRGSDAVRGRDIHLDLSGDQAAALAEAETEDDVREVIGQGLADYFNGGSTGAFSPEDFDFDPDGFELT
ncbi:hypothetical protein [Kitasatospora sp. NPDC088783]|uniref:hypothetical protein n=1 Tax=Kitasatospora sp. NPDC088783 TaxID=3364077 RepID=UPI003813B711